MTTQHVWLFPALIVGWLFAAIRIACKLLSPPISGDDHKPFFQVGQLRPGASHRHAK